MSGRFPLLDYPLEGRQLIEANAGTGKTWTIENLYLRFLLEKGLEVRQILVVTFTEAATAELRQRIRENLHAFQRHMESVRPTGGKVETSLFSELASRLEGEGRREACLRLLQDAILRFDEAAIFTIHGFCRRALQELAFETGTPFDAEVTADPRDFRWESVDDHLRRTYIGSHPLFVRRALTLKKKGLDGEVLQGIGKKVVADPGLEVRPPAAPTDPRAAGAAMEEAFSRARAIWADAKRREEVRSLLLASHPRLKGYGEKSLGKQLASLDSYLAGGEPLALDKPGKNLGAARLAECSTEGTPPSHELFGLLDDLDRAIAALDAGVVQARVAYARFARERAARSLREGGAFHFEDLLTRMRESLRGEGGAALAARLASRFRAALIDEFQDTDPVQFGIFDAIFSGIPAPVFLVGDPKQAIYRFRGADVHAYLAAAAGIPPEDRHPLLENHRSVPGLVEAVNALFRQDDSFALEGIAYQDSRSARDDLGLTETGPGGASDPAPFRIWQIPRPSPEGKSPIGKPAARARLFECAAAEIARLVEGGAKRSILLRSRDENTGKTREEPLRPGDIAVLVKTNKEARQVQRILREAGIHAVLQSAKSIFSSREAGELLRILQAIEEPGNDSRLLSALATDPLGVTARELERFLSEGDERFEGFRLRFRGYAREAEHGFMAMAASLMEKERVRERLLGLPDGERKLTNLLHLFELLHRAHPAHRGGVEAAVRWLTPLLAEKPEDDVSQLRLESDAEAVQVVTVHRSKGLQWPVVFCPAVWGDWKLSDTFPILHQGNHPTLDLGAPGDDTPEGKERKEMARKEARAESRRTLYVALTRARHRCTLGWGSINLVNESALAFLLHGRDPKPSSMSDAAIRADLDRFVAAAGGAATVAPLPEKRTVDGEAGGDASAAALSCRSIEPSRLRPSWSVSSFSRLESRAGKPEGEGRGDDQEQPAPWEEAHPAGRDLSDFLHMPGGKAAGDAVHRILERINFTDPGGESGRRLISSLLPRPEWTPALAARLEHVLSTPLGSSGAILREVPPSDRNAEMRFFLDRGKAEEWLWRSGGEGAERALDLETRDGLLNGSIDLVFRWKGRFWLLDWKTNNLGPEPAGYAPEALQREMERKLYTLQADIYSVALHRHLRARMGNDYNPARHFGGTLYLFLRGMSPEAAGLGVWERTADPASLEALDRSLGGGAP